MIENETPPPLPDDGDEQPVGKLGSMLPRLVREHQMTKAAESELTEALKTATLTGADVHQAPKITQ
jgi:hypothetical protein